MILSMLAMPALSLGQDQVQQGIDSFEAGEYDQAEAVFKQITEADDQQSTAFAYLGRIATRREQFSEAVDLLKEAIDLDENKVDYYLWLADSYIGLIQDANMIKQGYYARKVMKAFKEAATLDPSDLLAQSSLAEFYLEAPAFLGGNIEKAKAQTDIVAGLDSVAALSLYAQIAARENNTDLAISYYRRFLDSDPTNPDAHYQMGMFLQYLERWDEAVEFFDAALVIDAGHMGSLYQIGRTAVFAKTNLPRGIAALKQYLELGNYNDNLPTASNAYWRLGMLYEIGGQTDEAKDLFISALELDPDNSNAKKALRALKK